MKNLIAIAIFCLFTLYCYSQSGAKMDASKYRLVKTISQNGCKLFFWEGLVKETKFDVFVKKNFKGISTLSAMQPAMNGEYSLADKNNDGFIDFVTNYHGYDIIYLFNSKSNFFEKNPVHIPDETQLLDKKRNIYCCYQAAQYGDRIGFSILYQFRGIRLLNRLKLSFVTKEDYGTDIIRIDLYRLSDAGQHDEKFVKTIKVKRPSAFKYQNYWKKNYKKLLGYE